MHSADCYLNGSYLFYLGRAGFSLRSAVPLKARARPLTTSAPSLLCHSWGNKDTQRKEYYFQCPEEDDLENVLLNGAQAGGK